MQVNEAKADNAWVVPFRASGTRAPLFCACAGNGDVFEYRHLAGALPVDQPMYAFGLPVLTPSEQFPTVEKLASEYVRKVRELQTHGPYYLCGHSFGGLVVYAMAGMLSNEGAEIGLVGMFDTMYPRFDQQLSRGERARFRLTYLADRVSKYMGNVSRGRIDNVVSDASKYVHTLGKRLFWRASRAVFGKTGRQIPSAIRSNALVLTAAWRRFTPQAYNGRIVLINAADRPTEYRIDPTLGWKGCVMGNIDVRVVPGDHLSMLYPPNVHSLVEQLIPYLPPAAPHDVTT